MGHQLVVAVEVAHDALVVVVEAGCFDDLHLIFVHFESCEEDLLHHQGFFLLLVGLTLKVLDQYCLDERPTRAIDPLSLKSSFGFGPFAIDVLITGAVLSRTLVNLTNNVVSIRVNP